MANKKGDYYLNNPSLPTSRAEFEYTSEMIKNIKKCEQNLLFFAENYFYIIDPDEGRTIIKLYKYQKDALRMLRDNRYNLLLASRQIGKALDVNTPIPSPDGWKTMGELKDGDQIYAADGSICNVLKAHDVMHDRKCYKVFFDNGEEIIADADHLWFTQSQLERRTKQQGTTKTTQQLLNTLKTHGDEPNHRIPTCIAGVVGKHQQLPMDPYVLGLWLGNGCSDSGCITANNLVNSKHIPDVYLMASREQRLELLRGLIDSVEYMTKSGVCQFYNTNHTLVEQTKQLVESLGYKVTSKTHVPTLNGVECAVCSSITFTPIEPHINSSKHRAQWHYIKDIQEVESVAVRCITVDSKDNLYLCGKQYIPTHNTTLLTIYALWIACFNQDQNIMIVANKESTAIEIFRRVRLAYEQMPNWLKPGVDEYGKTSMMLNNGSRIGISTTTGSAARGTSLNCVDGNSIITVRNKTTQEVESITIAELHQRLEKNTWKTNLVEDSPSLI